MAVASDQDEKVTKWDVDAASLYYCSGKGRTCKVSFTLKEPRLASVEDTSLLVPLATIGLLWSTWTGNIASSTYAYAESLFCYFHNNSCGEQQRGVHSGSMATSAHRNSSSQCSALNCVISLSTVCFRRVGTFLTL
jgi:hypothetical protein